MSDVLLDRLRELLRGRVVIMGVGNPLRGDDAVGSVLARQLRARFPDTISFTGAAAVTVIDAEEIPESWVGPAVGASPDAVLLIDAVELGASPGEAALLSAAELGGETLFTHRTPLRPVAEYLTRATGARIALLGIQPGPNRLGEELSPVLAAAAADLVLILTEVLKGTRAETHAPEAIAC